MGSLLSSFFSLLSSLLSLLCSLVVAVRCPKGLVPLWRLHCGTSGGLFGSLCSLLSSLFVLLSSLSALFPLLSLPLISQIALRTCPCDLRIRPSTSPPTAATLCGSLPGPAECAKRLNPPSPWRRAGSSALIYNHFISLPPPIILPGGPAHSAGPPRQNLF